MHILHTVLYTFPKVWQGEFLLQSLKSFFSWWSFPLFSWHYCVIQWRYCKEKLDASHSWGLKDQYHPKRKFSLCYPQTGWADDIFYISKKKKRLFTCFWSQFVWTTRWLSENTKHSLLNGDKSFVFSYRPKQLRKVIQFHQNRRRWCDAENTWTVHS